MLRLNLERGPTWFDLGHGVRVQCEPVTTLTITAARREPEIRAMIAESANEEDLGVAVTKAVARRIILAWEGIGDAEGNPAPVSPEGVDALLDIWEMFDAFQTRVLSGAVLLDREKNASAPSPHGTTAAAESIAPPAGASATSARPKSTGRKR